MFCTGLAGEAPPRRLAISWTAEEPKADASNPDGENDDDRGSGGTHVESGRDEDDDDDITDSPGGSETAAFLSDSFACCSWWDPSACMHHTMHQASMQEWCL